MFTVVGDTTYFGLDSGLPSYDCRETLTLQDLGSSDPSIIGIYQNGVRFIPKKNGIWYDTVNFHWLPSNFQNEGCMDVFKTAYITAYGTDDSTVKLRPQVDYYIPMREKKSLGQWDGYFTIRLDNSIASPTIFKNFRLRYNLPPGLQVEILDGNKVIPSYSAKAFERQKSLTAHLWLPGAPLSDSVSFQGDFVLDAASNDTTRQLSSSSLYVTMYPFTGSSVSESVNPESLALHIFPNPLKGLSQISFSLPEQSECRLRIVNILGNEIKAIFKGVKDQGTQNIFFDASEIPAGEYFCELQAGKSITRQKLIIGK